MTKPSSATRTTCCLYSVCRGISRRCASCSDLISAQHPESRREDTPPPIEVNRTTFTFRVLMESPTNVTEKKSPEQNHKSGMRARTFSYLLFVNTFCQRI